jgi:hypothetical protein
VQVLPLIFVVPLAGPPVILLLGPLLLLVLLLSPAAAFLITLVVVLLVGAGLLVALGALIASPFLLVRHLREREPPSGAGSLTCTVPPAEDVPFRLG